jgi:glutaredoxin-like protein NrdH
VKEFLSRAGYAFESRNIEEDDAAFNELMALGARSVPLTLVGSRQVRGYDLAKLREALAAAVGEP